MHFNVNVVSLLEEMGIYQPIHLDQNQIVNFALGRNFIESLPNQILLASRDINYLKRISKMGV